ncbi:MAG: Hpt domain-containing protein, partial [Deltaproteobacteria bacterium]|nr:Hpt domain-containing protein [Deltaproteobacteria bacterium]
IGGLPAFSRLRNIRGLNTDVGILCANDSEKDYIDVLRIYCKDSASRIPILKEAADRGDMTALAIQAHALKSATASIGASGLARKASFLEESGRQCDADAVCAALEPFLKEIGVLLERIAAALDEPAKSFSAPVLGDASAMTLYDTSLRLLQKALIEEDIRAADENLALLESLPLDGPRRVDVAAIGERILTAEFKDALRIVETMLQA